jgi:hypothetical protein
MLRGTYVPGAWFLDASDRPYGFRGRHVRDVAIVLYPDSCIFLARLFELFRAVLYSHVLGIHGPLVPWVYVLDCVRDGNPPVIEAAFISLATYESNLNAKKAGPEGPLSSFLLLQPFAQHLHFEQLAHAIG